MRVNRGQEFVIGGYTLGTRNGFSPALRAQLFRKFRGIESDVCPFANRWLKPVLVGQFEFLEWTADDHLRQVTRE